MSDKRNKIVVIGAGLIGASIGYHLSARGADVTILDKDRPATGATAKSFAWINASAGNGRQYFELRLRAIQDWHRLQRELPDQITINWRGSLEWQEDKDALAGAVREQRQLGYPLEELSSAEIKSAEPRLHAPPGQAIFAPLEGALDPVETTHALLSAAQDCGARLDCDARVESFVKSTDQITGVQTSAGEFACDHCVLAAGTETQDLAALAGSYLPMQSSAGLLMHSEPTDPVISRLVLAPACHMKQEPDGRIVAGKDFAGAADLSDPKAEAAAQWRKVQSYLTGLEEVALGEPTIGYRPMPEDGFPAVGPAPGAPGLTIAVMHSGVTLAALMGRLLAQELIDGVEADCLTPYRPARFGQA